MYINFSSTKIKKLRNLVLDYDGVVKYKNHQLTQAVHKELLELLHTASRSGPFVLHINSLRGISFFKEVGQIKDIIDLPQLVTYFSGCNGAYTFDIKNMRKHSMLAEALPVDLLEKISISQNVKKILQKTKQNDGLTQGTDKLETTFTRLDSRLYWDTGYPGSKLIYKCAIDIGGVPSGLIIDLQQELATLKTTVTITNSILEITPFGHNKRSAVLDLMNKGNYKQGTIVAIGDNPEGSDGPMLRFETNQPQFNFIGISNNDNVETSGNIDEEILATNAVKLFSQLKKCL